jgi:hypothetical protein
MAASPQSHTGLIPFLKPYRSALVVAAMICFVLAYRSLVAAAKRRKFRTIGGAGREALKQNTKLGRFSL